MNQLIHHGIIIPRFQAKGYSLEIKGERIPLSREQEEMAVAWVKKLGTDYVKDKIFIQNFLIDFSQILHRNSLKLDDLDFSEIQNHLFEEKNQKLMMSKKEQKRAAQERKLFREANREKYGYATVDGIKVEIANYMAEPSSIFIGRGNHPLRGHWKRGPEENDITLNLSPDASVPPGNWKSIVWQPSSLWVAQWRDHLQGKMKYVWLSDTAFIKQARELEKFEKARMLETQIKTVRTHITKHLTSPDPTKRKIATICYLIDVLKLRVGDEKESDEADTVGASTLRPEHISFTQDGLMILNFLGKDSVRWHLETKLPDQIIQNIKELLNDTNMPIFKGIRSENVNTFLSEVVPELTAKVFRTYHATNIVKDVLDNGRISESSPEIQKKYIATMANLKAAEACNHKKKIPKNWNESLQKMLNRLKEYQKKKNELKTTKLTKRIKIQRLKKIDVKIMDLKMRVAIKKQTRDYNLTTSLKSYIDPRVYYHWGNNVDYDWKKYYSKGLQRKFLWIEKEDNPERF